MKKKVSICFLFLSEAIGGVSDDIQLSDRSKSTCLYVYSVFISKIIYVLYSNIMYADQYVIVYLPNLQQIVHVLMNVCNIQINNCLNMT